MTIPLKDSKDPNSKAALARLEQIKNQLNLGPSAMSLQAPKDMAAERAAADFDIKKLSWLWAGGEEAYNLLNSSYAFIKNDPELVVQPPRNILEMSRAEQREFNMGQIYRANQLSKDKPLNLTKEQIESIIWATNIYSESFSMRFFVHASLFKNAINMLGSKGQQDEWNDKIQSLEVIGCFAMTELGHSSALRDIETTATYDIATDEFVIESPTVTSSKWWIGMAGQTATHTVAIAQTIIHGKNVGLNWFIVQLRSQVDGSLMPSVVAGDIGQKVGHVGVDNGWIQFHRTRIPRKNMLSKWVSLDRHGNFSPPPNPAVMYATLIPERFALVLVTTQMISQAILIATRYGVVRRQGPKNEQIMDYQSHYVKLVPAISFMYMVKSAQKVLDDQFSVLTAGGNMDPITYLNYMGEMHAMAACFKGLTGWYSSEILEDCRRACGGHAYSSYNAIGSIIGDWGVMTTGGGDNVVLLQQAARHLLFRLEQKLKFNQYPDFSFKSSTHYINYAEQYLGNTKWNVPDISQSIGNFSVMEEAMCTILVKRLNSIQKSLESGKSHGDLLLESVRVAEMHCAVFLFSTNAAAYHKSTADPTLDKSVLSILNRLTILWGIHTLYKYSDQGYREGFLNPEQIKDIETIYFDYCKSLRSQVIGLTDGFGYPDFIVKAPIGKYDGDIYQAYFDTLLQAPGSVQVPPYHEKYIKPLTNPSK
ncbi:hypothetical protein CLU79DRAFT_724499 [Phycomyces nitens]|nr:hypothetical protein CLU79DRAFT_724499 [Phycomyces nitens]